MNIPAEAKLFLSTLDVMLRKSIYTSTFVNMLSYISARHTSLFTLQMPSWTTFRSRSSALNLYPLTVRIHSSTVSIGAIDPNTVAKVVKQVTEEDKRRQAMLDARPPLDEILNLHDFEVRT